MSDARLAIIISAVNQASRELKQIRDEVQGLGDAGKNANKGGLQALKDGFSAVQGAALKAYAAFKITKEAVDKVYQAAREGADLVYLEQKFDNLSRSIGTTSNALLMDLRSAVKGTKSDMELMAGASDMLALGLAKTHDQAVRLTAVAGALGWNMDQLTLTITNETTKRLDTLGLSVESVKGRYEALKEAGIDGQQAMLQAVIEAGEAMVNLQGHVGDTTLGAYQRMEASQANFFAKLKADLAEGATGWAEFWDSAYQGMITGIDNAASKNIAYELGWTPDKMMPGTLPKDKQLPWHSMFWPETWKVGYGRGSGEEAWWEDPQTLQSANELRIALEGLTDYAYEQVGKNIDWDKWFNSSAYRQSFKEQVEGWNNTGAAVERARKAVEKTGATYDDYEDQQKAVVEQYKRIAAARKQAIDDGVKAHHDMQGALQGITGETDKVSAAMTLWLNTQQGMTTFVGLLRTYTVELEGIKEKKARIVELEEIVKNNGGIYDGQKISAEKARQEIEKLNEAINNSHQRMKNVVKDAIANAYIQQVMAGSGTMGEKFNQIFGFLEKHGLASKEALQALREELELYDDDIAELTGTEHVVNVQTEVDGKELDDLRKDVENYKSDLKVKTVLDSGETDEYKPPSKKMWVEAKLNALNVEKYEPPTNKKLKVSIELDTKAVDGYNPPTRYGSVVYLPNNTLDRATGGTVQAAAAGRSASPRGNYLWQEYGYPGEIFVPSMSGYILSKADASRAVSAGQSSAMDYGSFESAFENALTRVLDRRDLRAGYQQQPLRSAFENVRNW